MKEATRGVADWGKDSLIFEHRDENHDLIATHKYPYYILYLCPLCKRDKNLDMPITAYWRVPKGTPPIPQHAMKIALNDVTANRFKCFDAGVIQGIEYYVADQDRDLEAPHKHSKYGYRNPYYLYNILNPQTNVSHYIEEVNRRAKEVAQPRVKGKARPKFRALPEKHYIRAENLERFYAYIKERSKVEQHWERPDYVIICDKKDVGECFFYAAERRREFDEDDLKEMGAESAFEPVEELGRVAMKAMAPAENPLWYEYHCHSCGHKTFDQIKTFKVKCPKCGGEAYRRPYEPFEENRDWKGNPAVISAPHSASRDPRHYEGHPSDTIVAELAVHLSEALKERGISHQVILSGTPREERDMNRKEGRGSPFREAIRKAIRGAGHG